MDALTHAVEVYIGNSTTAGTRADALFAVKMIFENIDRAYCDGSDLGARKNMLLAAFSAGCAFSKSYVGYVHAVAHSLGGEYNVPHGLAIAVLLPFVLESYGHTIDAKLHQLAHRRRESQTRLPRSHRAATQFIQAIKDMKKRFSIGDTIPQIREEDIPKLASYAEKEANPFIPYQFLWMPDSWNRFIIF